MKKKKARTTRTNRDDYMSAVPDNVIKLNTVPPADDDPVTAQIDAMVAANASKTK